MYKVTFEKGYREIVFKFNNYMDASTFVEMALASGDGNVEICISYEPEKDGLKQCEDEEEGEE